MNEIEEILSIEPCDCGRDYCQYFGAGIGNVGVSFSAPQLKALQKELKAATSHINKLIKAQSDPR